MQTFLTRIATALVLLAASAVPSLAVPISYQITGPGIDFSFDIDSDVTSDPGFRTNGINQFVVGASGDAAFVTFFDSSQGGGFFGGPISGSSLVFDVFGDQLFSGTPDAPTLLTGVFSGGSASSAMDVTITVTNASTVIPLPATLPLLLAGMGGLVLLRRRPVA
ncbi:MAG: VPLPA-CTERM sorting domain-containing protein [Pseudomonadota bacterium]